MLVLKLRLTCLTSSISTSLRACTMACKSSSMAVMSAEGCKGKARLFVTISVWACVNSHTLLNFSFMRVLVAVCFFFFFFFFFFFLCMLVCLCVFMLSVYACDRLGVLFFFFRKDLRLTDLGRLLRPRQSLSRDAVSLRQVPPIARSGC